MNDEAWPETCGHWPTSYQPAKLHFSGSELDVGMRVKGGCGSGRSLERKASLKLNLSWDDPSVPGCPREQRLHGLKRLTFNNMVQDPTMTHEMVAYKFYRKLGLPSPRTACAEIYLNHEYWGLYLHAESIDRRKVIAKPRLWSAYRWR